MYAIAGVSGKTGSAVAARLLAAGEQVRVIVRRADAGDDWQAKGADVAVADLGDAASVTAALRGANAAYLLNPPSYEDENPVGRATVIGKAFAHAIDASGIERAVVLSAVSAHLSAGNGIIATNNALEQALAGVRTPTASVRAQYFFENWGVVLQPVREAGMLPSFLGPADHRFPMVAVADIADEIVTLLREPLWQGRRIVELSSFDASPAEVAQALSSALGKAVDPLIVPRDQWSGILAGNGFSPATVSAFVEMYDGINAGIVAPEAGRENVRGRTSLQQAARGLLA
jgi:uncharacterized protein YbjT (DUF2867 family)